MWAVRIHPLVFDEDFKKIDRTAQRRIIQTLYKKLSLAPEEYGKPLGGEFKGYWRLRVDDYRVIYRMEKAHVQVFVIKVGFRGDEELYRQLRFRAF
jgi:mRNA interferase RelE/StbE